MKKLIILINLTLLLVIAGCMKNSDPVDRFVTFMETQLKILDKHQDDPPAAALALAKQNAGDTDEITKLSQELMRNHNIYNTDVKKQEVKEKIEPLLQRMMELVNKNPALFLNEDVAKVFKAFDLGF